MVIIELTLEAGTLRSRVPGYLVLRHQFPVLLVKFDNKDEDEYLRSPSWIEWLLNAIINGMNN